MSFGIILAVSFTIGLVFSGSVYTVKQTEQVIITQFGKTIGEPITEPGLYFKTPFIQTVNSFDKRYLSWDGQTVEISSKDKTYIQVDTFARWRIADPMKYYLRLKDERSALSRLDDILGSEIRTSVARNNLIEVVRTDKNRKPLVDESAGKLTVSLDTLKPNTVGRTAIEKEIFEAASPKLIEYGVELLDLRFKRINYNGQVLERIYQRMISERLQIAEQFRSEGEGESARIMGNKEKDINQIKSTAYKKVQEIRGEADAKATEIYAKAYNQSPESASFYTFVKGMDTYKKVIDGDTTIVLSTNSDLYGALKRVNKK